MIFNETAIPGIISIEASPARDERGAFLRSWCRESFTAAGWVVRLWTRTSGASYDL